MNDQTATVFLRDVRHPLLALHRSVLAHLRARHEAEFGPTSPGEFLQIVINGSAYRWLTPFSALIPSLTSNKIDIISAAMLITPARQEVIDFSDPVFPYPEGMIVKPDDKKG